MFALLPALALAQEPTKTKFDLSGSYSAWALSQHNFLFGAEHPLDDANYVVQALRLRVEASRTSYGVTAQIDGAQGWWGVDNSPNNRTISSIDPATGAIIETPTYNTDALFADKDTNYAVHLDTAFGWFLVGPVRFQIGRQPFLSGHRLVLDEDLDGATASLKASEALSFGLSWAKIAEGKAALTLPSGALMSDQADGMSDVDLFGLHAKLSASDGSGEPVSPEHFHKAELFAWLYRDTIGSDFTHLPSGLGYAKSRFSPNVSDLLAVGLAGEGRHRKVFGYKFEADILAGRDGVDNQDHALGQLDRNNGRLFGFNLYGEGTTYLDIGRPVDASLIAGLGSGDEDVTSGAGNVNKISTMGFFPLLNVWEDSVMPDIQGISPQGLGSPVSRGYRELENTTIGALKLGGKPVDRIRIEAVAAWLRATQPVRGFDATGTPTGSSSGSLGWEVDANGTLSLFDAVSLKLLWGYFQPGTAALYVINGNSAADDAAWELKSELLVKF